MKQRFEGSEGRRRLRDTLLAQKVFSGNVAIAEALVDQVEVIEVADGDALITEGDFDNDMYFVVAGSFNVRVKGRLVAQRIVGDHVGEMAAIEPSLPRSATVISDGTSVVARLSEAMLAQIGSSHPDIWRSLAKELARRLYQRRDLIPFSNEQPRMFCISSKEAIKIAQEIQLGLVHDFLVTVWTDGVFFASGYPLEALERAVEESDFAVAVAQPDDVVQSRGECHSSLRDNVVFELGLFMGKLGRPRTILLQPQGRELKLPSDLQGLTAIQYRTGPEKDLAANLASTCTEMRKLVRKLGVRN